MQEVETSLKVIVVGNGQVGKTSMVTRYAKGLMTENYKKTIGTDFFEKEIKLKPTGESIRLMVWDTAGQEMFAKLTRNYYKGAGAVVYVFSTTDRESFMEIERWQRKVRDECGDICSVLVQNKMDLIQQAVMTPTEVEDLARKLSMKLYRVSVKDNVLIDEVFDDLATMFMRKGGDVAHEAVPSMASLSIGKRDDDKDGSKRNGAADANGTGHGTESAAASSSNGNGSGGGGGGASSNGSSLASHGSSASSNSQSSSLTSPASTGTTVRLEPVTRRTGGKKDKCRV